jgi:hypothetical protein
VRLILGQINGRYLREITDNAAKDTEYVEAAVAYASDQALLFDWCWDQKIPLYYWGRFDDGVPVGLPILERFLARRSPTFVCKLVRHHHAKVIWWHGFGAYVGSANLSAKAWYNNIEAGFFLTEDELISNGFADELRKMFVEMDKVASPLSDEVMNVLRQRQRDLNRRNEADSASADALLNSEAVHQWSGLTHVSRKSASEAGRVEFLREWRETLQILRDIGAIVSRPENRPPWLREDAPLGTQADQFLHAYYYNRTMDGRRADWPAHYERNKLDPGRALSEAVGWWRLQNTPPSNEDRTLNEWAPLLQDRLSEPSLRALGEAEFIEVFERVHSIIEYARRVPNKAVGLPENVGAHSMEVKIKALARHVYNARSASGRSAIETLHYVLYGGSQDDTPLRLWDAMHDPQWKIDRLGVSGLGELVGWALPDRFPPRNGRTSKALRALGRNVTIHN